MSRTRIPGRASQLKSKGKKPMGRIRTRWISQTLEDTKKKGLAKIEQV
jgi:hypothetical protein